MMSIRSIIVLLAFFIFLAASKKLDEKYKQDELSNLSTFLRATRSAEANNKRIANKRKKVQRGGKKKVRKGKAKKNNKKEKRKHKNRKKSNARKGKKNLKRNQKKKKRVSSRALTGDCLVSAVIAMKRWKDAVGNFDKQLIRATKKSELAEKKFGKKDFFKPVALKLIDVGGGNKSALTCAGSNDSVGAKQLSNLTQTLEACEEQINSTCHPENLPAPDQYEGFKECNISVTSFKIEIQNCFEKSKDAETSEEACECWTSSNMTELSNSVATCKVDAASFNNKAVKECIDVFSKCRKFEDDSVSSIKACSQSVSELAEKATVLTKNKDALGDVKAKIAKATSSTRINPRAPATNCQEFLVLVTQSNNLFYSILIINNFYFSVATITIEFPSSSMILTIALDITQSVDPTCTEDEKNSLKEQESKVDEGLEAVESALEVAESALSGIQKRNE